MFFQSRRKDYFNRRCSFNSCLLLIEYERLKRDGIVRSLLKKHWQQQKEKKPKQPNQPSLPVYNPSPQEADGNNSGYPKSQSFRSCSGALI
jgi:hypothetical protein